MKRRTINLRDAILSESREDHIWEAHRLTAEEVLSACEDAHAYIARNLASVREGQERFGAIAQDINGQYLVIIFHMDYGRPFIITARPAKRCEIRRYKQHRRQV